MNLGIRFNNATTLQIPLKTVQWCMKKLAFVFFSLQFIVRSHAIVCQLSYQTTVEKCSSLFFFLFVSFSIQHCRMRLLASEMGSLFISFYSRCDKPIEPF